MGENIIRKIGTLGGSLKVKKENSWMYVGNSARMNKERLFGVSGPLHIGMPSNKHEIAEGATYSDTKQDLIRELTDQSGFTRREAERIVEDMVKQGKLVEINHPDLGKVLVFRR